MSPVLGRQAVVVVAGMAGLAASRALSQFFERVVVLETDPLPAGAATRPGTPQCRHAHALLAGGQRVLAALFPHFERDLAQAGAVPLRVASDFLYERPNYDIPARDLGFRIFSMSRPLIEAVARGCVRGCGNIELRERWHAKEFVVDRNRAQARISGVRCEELAGSREQLDAELVVDASGHGSLTLAALAAADKPAPEEISIGVDIGYATTLLEDPADAAAEWKCLLTLPDYPHNTRGAIILPAEGHRWMVTVSGRYDENRRERPSAMPSAWARSPYSASRPAAGAASIRRQDFLLDCFP